MAFGRLALAPSLARRGRRAAGVFTSTYRGTVEDETDLSTYTFSALDVGAASSDRIVIAAVYSTSSGNTTATSCTIGGVTATLIQGESATGTRHLNLYFAAVPTGTTADIVVVRSGVNLRCAVSWWTITGTTQVTYSARGAANTEINASATAISSPVSGSITVPSGGVGICAIWLGATKAGPLFTFSQTSGSGTKRLDEQLGTSTLYGGAYDTATSGAQQFTATQSGSAAQMRSVSVAWGPVPPLTINGSPPATASVGVAYSFTPTTTGGKAPLTFSLVGSLPAGLSFNTATGAITGTPS